MKSIHPNKEYKDDELLLEKAKEILEGDWLAEVVEEGGGLLAFIDHQTFSQLLYKAQFLAMLVKRRFQKAD